ncbi:MAG: polysaccharide pyruvyl transferase family protein [Clostridia bacterium]|nr:polysaccharide pyruvyl transferase family protein [Clostridia bacterium]
MEKKKIGVATVFTGFNYGSALQAFATKTLLSEMGYDGEILKLGGSLLPGRDVRIKKTITVLLRSSLHPGGMKSLKNYGDSIKKPLSSQSREMFRQFADYKLCPCEVKYKDLKKSARSDEYYTFLCGSDQVWNSAVFYVDPFYYLRFAPEEKRVAFAPSFGRDFVPKYNKRKIKKYVSGIKHKSVREESGVQLIKELTGDTAQVLIDPTLVLTPEEWTKALKIKETGQEKYLLAYFLDEPSPKAKKAVMEISEKYGLKIIGLPYSFDGIEWASNIAYAGPSEFVEYIKNASFVCTDSFHGTAFSLNFNIPFYTFERNYGNAGKQSARIQSILGIVSESGRYEPENIEKPFDISFEKVNMVLEEQREKSKKYLSDIIPLANGKKTEEKTGILEKGNIRDCTGCGVCEAVCPVGAIKIAEGGEGFYTPVIDEEKCTNCGICKKSCYKFDEAFTTKENEDYECYGAVNKNKKELLTASSGGVSVELMKAALKDGYFVVGVAYDVKENRAVTKIAKTQAELEAFKGSKYFQSYTAEAFKEILSDKSEQKYAVFGTPCQIYALSKAAEQKKISHRFLFIDIFCHGCPSLKLWDKYLQYVKEKKHTNDFSKIIFRSKTHGWHEYCFDFFTTGKSFSSSKYNDPFHEMFFGLDAMNKACYDCVARSTVEKTDIRIGDFWGKRHDMNTKGVSAVVIASEKGKKLFDSVKDSFDIEKADFNEIISEQSYKKIHKVNFKRREETLSLLSGEKKLTEIVRERRKKLSFFENLKRKIKSTLKYLPEGIYLKIKTKLR